MANTYLRPFGQTQKAPSAVATAAVTLTGAGSLDNDTPSNTVLLLTAGSNPGGSICTGLHAIQRATTATAISLFIWSSLDSGTTKRLILSELMDAHTVAATSEIPKIEFRHPDGTIIDEENPLRLEAGEKLYCGIATAVTAGVVFSARLVDA